MIHRIDWLSGRQARFACALLATMLSVARAAPAPHCPGPKTDSDPPYGPIGGPPALAVWKGLTELPASCLTDPGASAPLIVALAGRFRHPGSVDDLAARFGAISTTIGLPYWSVTDRSWKSLVSDAAALGSPDPADERADFDAAQVLSGDTLYFAQNDTRSWGTNVYRLRALEASPDRMVVQTENVSGIKLGPVTLFDPQSVASVHFVERLEGSTWAYYGLTMLRDSAFEAREKSLINRQAALYRLLIGEAPDRAPPLAP